MGIVVARGRRPRHRRPLLLLCSPSPQYSGRSPSPPPAVQRCSSKTFNASAPCESHCCSNWTRPISFFFDKIILIAYCLLFCSIILLMPKKKLDDGLLIPITVCKLPPTFGSICKNDCADFLLPHFQLLIEENFVHQVKELDFFFSFVEEEGHHRGREKVSITAGRRSHKVQKECQSSATGCVIFVLFLGCKSWVCDLTSCVLLRWPPLDSKPYCLQI